MKEDLMTELKAPPMGVGQTAIFVAWTVQDFAVATWFPEDPAFRHQSPLYWYDSDWLGALVAIIVGSRMRNP